MPISIHLSPLEITPRSIYLGEKIKMTFEVTNHGNNFKSLIEFSILNRPAEVYFEKNKVLFQKYRKERFLNSNDKIRIKEEVIIQKTSEIENLRIFYDIQVAVFDANNPNKMVRKITRALRLNNQVG